MSKRKHLFGAKVPTVEVAAKRYAATASLNLTDPYPEVEAAFMQMIRDVRAEAWDEGAAYVNAPFGIEPGMRNPYRPTGEVA